MFTIVLFIPLFLEMASSNPNQLAFNSTPFWFQQEDWFNKTPWFKHLQKNQYYDVVACTHAIDEWFLLRELVVRNFLAGVEHFYIYDMSQGIYWDRSVEALREFVDAGLVTHVKYVWRKDDGYMVRCVANARRISKWIAIIDSDEHITFDSSKYRNNLATYLKEFESFGALLIYWRLFPSNCQFLHRKETLTKLFTHYCEGSLDNGQFKLIAQSKYIDQIIKHGVTFLEEKYAVNSNFTPYLVDNLFDYMVNWIGEGSSLSYRSWENVTHVPIYLAHYWSRSFEDFMWRIRRSNNYRTPSVDWFYKEHVRCHSIAIDTNAVELVQFVDNLLSQMQPCHMSIFDDNEIYNYNFRLTKAAEASVQLPGRLATSNKKRWKYFFDKVIERKDFLPEEYLKKLNASQIEEVSCYHCPLLAYMMNYTSGKEIECEECWT